MNLDSNKYELPIEQISYNRIFLLSDLHFGVRANSLEWLQNQQDFFYNFYIPFLKSNKKDGDILFILGDWFDNRQLLDIYIMNASIDIMVELRNIIPIYFLTGNHDIYKKHDTDVNSLRTFKFIPGITIYEKPNIITNGETKIMILPWIGDKDEEENYIKENRVDYIFAHADIEGFRYDNGKIIMHGVNFQYAKGTKRIFSGHIHKRQEDKKLIYIGSPYHTKRSDIDNEKGNYILDPKENTVIFEKNTLSSIFQRIRLEDLMEYTLDDVIKILENNYTDIIVPDKFIHLFNLTNFVELLQDCKYKKIETTGEKNRIEDSFNEIIGGEEIKDILTLLEISIDDSLQEESIRTKLKLLNKQYYEKANKEEVIY
jgi:DNA repair exonuclease SbcCD nuclease subunit